MNPQNLLLVVRWPVGGIRTYLRDVYSRLSARGWRISIMTIDVPEAKVLKDELGAAIAQWWFLREHPSNLEFAAAAYKHAGESGASLIHAHGFTAGFLALLPGKLRGVPVLLTFHDVFLPFHFQGLAGRAKHRLMRTLLQGFNGLHLISNDVRTNLYETFPGLKVKQEAVILNGIDAEKLRQATPKDIRTDLRLPAETFLFGFLGRFMAQKGFGFLVEAVRTLQANAVRPFVILCVGGGGFQREEQTRIKELELESYFRFLPFERNVGSLMKGLDTVIMPSRWEACPLLPMEVLACGTPLIASNCVGLREVVAGTPARVFPVGDVPDLAYALGQALQRGVGADKSAYTAYATIAAQRFSIERAVAGLEDFYRRILALPTCQP